MSSLFDKPCISIVMSAHNADAYIGRAVESLQRQTFENFELLVVDDGSKDRTRDIVSRIADRDIRITLLQVSHVGTCKAWDIALSRARGTYVMFMRAQDWLEPQALFDLVAAAEKNHLELTISGFVVDVYYGKNNEHISETRTCRSCVFSTQADFRKTAWQLFDAGQLSFAWGKLYVRELIQQGQTHFDSPGGGEFAFVLDYIRDVECVGLIQCPSYHFVNLGGVKPEAHVAAFAGSRVSSNDLGGHFDLYEHYEAEYDLIVDLYRHWGLDGDSSSTEMIQRHYIEHLIACIQTLCDSAKAISSAQCRQQVGAMITSERAQHAIQITRPQTVVMALFIAAIRSRNVSLAIAEGRLISYIARHDTRALMTLTKPRARASALSYEA